MSDFLFIAVPTACFLIAFVVIPAAVWAGGRRETEPLDEPPPCPVYSMEMWRRRLRPDRDNPWAA